MPDVPLATARMASGSGDLLDARQPSRCTAGMPPAARLPADGPAWLILARIDELGGAEVARRVAPVWGCSPDSAESRLVRWRAHVEGRASGRDVTSTPLFQLLSVLGLTVAPVAAGGE